MFKDPTESHLQLLQPEVARLAVRLINEVRAAGWPLIITSSRRTVDEQARLVAAGLSRNPRSLHLTGHAFDVDLAGMSRDRVPSAFWQAFGPFAEGFGFTWGGRWKSPYDPGHLELRAAARVSPS